MRTDRRGAEASCGGDAASRTEPAAPSLAPSASALRRSRSAPRASEAPSRPDPDRSQARKATPKAAAGRYARMDTPHRANRRAVRPIKARAR